MVSVEFDAEVNALYLRLKKGKIEKSKPVADNIVFDLDENGEIIGIEILLPKANTELLRALSRNAENLVEVETA